MVDEACIHLKFSSNTGLSDAVHVPRQRAKDTITRALASVATVQLFTAEAGVTPLLVRPFMLYTEHVLSCVTTFIVERNTGTVMLAHLSPSSRRASPLTMYQDCVNSQLKPLLERVERTAILAGHTASVTMVFSHGYRGDGRFAKYLQDIYQPPNTSSIQVGVRCVNLGLNSRKELDGATYVMSTRAGEIDMYVISTSIHGSECQSLSTDTATYSYICPQRARDDFHHPILFNASLRGHSPEKDIVHGQLRGIGSCVARCLEPWDLQLHIIDLSRIHTGEQLHRCRVIYSNLYWAAVDRIVQVEHAGVVPVPVWDLHEDC